MSGKVALLLRCFRSVSYGIRIPISTDTSNFYVNGVHQFTDHERADVRRGLEVAGLINVDADFLMAHIGLCSEIAKDLGGAMVSFLFTEIVN